MSPWNCKTPLEIEDGEVDQDELVTVAESCEQRQLLYDCTTAGNFWLRAREKDTRR